MTTIMGAQAIRYKFPVALSNPCVIWPLRPSNRYRFPVDATSYAHQPKRVIGDLSIW